MDSPLNVQITPRRLDELMRWHGTDESDLPPAHTLQNLSRDTIAALVELKQSRDRIERLRAAMGRAFWAADARELHGILLEALGPLTAAPEHCLIGDIIGPAEGWPLNGGAMSTPS